MVKPKLAPLTRSPDPIPTASTGGKMREAHDKLKRQIGATVTNSVTKTMGQGIEATPATQQLE